LAFPLSGVKRTSWSVGRCPLITRSRHPTVLAVRAT